MVAKEFQTSVSWVRTNLKIVAPRDLSIDMETTLANENAMGTSGMYLILNDDGKAIQAAWEIDMEDNGRSAHKSEIDEHRRANQVSRLDPWTYAPSILFPSSYRWTIKINIRHDDCADTRT